MKIYLVGGAVRDKLLGLPIKEHDYVVVGASVADMLALGYKQVGKEFPVFLHPKTGAEYALARMERKVKPGYKGFVFDSSPEVTLEEDLQRRDLTINAMAYDLDAKKIIDPFGGQKDIQQKILRHVSTAFAEDPVRILRVGRFLARYADLGFHVDAKTLALMRNMVKKGEVDALVAERVWKELDRALAEKNPDQFFAVLKDAHALAILFAGLGKQGRKALQETTTISPSSVVRFAALLHAYPENETDRSNAKKMLSKLCDRYRVPNQYRELAILTALYHETAIHAKKLTATELIKLFSSLDIFRRSERFENFILACKGIAAAQDVHFDADWLIKCAQVAKSVDVQSLLAQKLNGQQLAMRLKSERLSKITEWLKLNQT